MKTHDHSLLNCLETEQKRLCDITDSLPINLRRVYGNWLAQTYYFVCHSTRLLGLVASRLGTKDHELHLRFIDHTREERNHEALALRDLKNLGFTLADFPELPETQAFYQTQYYWIEHQDPTSFFGYILCLESFAIGGGNRLYQEALRSFGEKSTVFLKVHVREDVDHVKQAISSIETLDTNRLALIRENLRLSSHLYRSIYLAITEANRAMPTPMDKKAA